MMKKISRRSSRNICLCFNPVVLEDRSDFEPEEPSEAIKAVLSSPVLDMMTSDDNDTDVVTSFSRKSKIGRRSFSRYVKAVFFETSLVKKMRDKKLERKIYKTINSIKTKSKKKFKIAQPIHESNNNNISSELNHKSCSSAEEEADNDSTSNCSTLMSSGFGLTSRCSSSSHSFNSRYSSSSERPENNTGRIYKLEKGCRYGRNVGIFLFLISLFVLVLWGKICAILCTSTWLFFTYRRSLKLSSSGNNNYATDHQFPEIDTEKLYKKKVIMEGLLERNHCRSCYYYKPC